MFKFDAGQFFTGLLGVASHVVPLLAGLWF